MHLKNIVNIALSHFGYRINRINAEPSSFGVDPFRDMRVLNIAGDRPLILDVGANIGQSVERFQRTFRKPIIHSFEPSPEAFDGLRKNTTGSPDLVLNNYALGSRAGDKTFFESEAGTPMSSLLEPGTECWGGGGIKGSMQVQVSTIDDYCHAQAIDSINILKIDTQGYDFEVIKGAIGMIQSRAVHMIYMEIIFCNMYKGLPRMDQIYGFLADHGFQLVTFYTFYYWGNKASWTEGLFVHPEYRPS